MSPRTLKPPTWICSQIGAREHYAVPRALHQGGRLATLYTDFWAGPVIRRLKFGRLRPLAARSHSELANDHPKESGSRNMGVRSWNLQALGWELLLRQRAKREKKNAESPKQSQLSAFNRYGGFIEVGRRFAVCVRKDLEGRKDLPPGTIFYAYDTGALEAFEWCHNHGIKCVLNQMDPNRVEVELVRTEEIQWPGWALQAIQVPEAYFTRRQQEWALADRVVVNSEFSRQALLRQGVPAKKLAVIPLCFEVKKVPQSSETLSITPQPSASSPLRVLFLGQVILRKGIQYLIGAAKLLEKENIQFDVVGPIGISREAVAKAPANVTFHGRTGRDEATAWYRRSHLFVLPTLSDGFAITQLEAMAHGLPVLATPCCGEVVSDGVDGFIVPPRDADTLARILQRYLKEPELLRCQSTAALLKARQFTLGRLADNLLKLEGNLASCG